jgi:hypothetical protein
MPITLITISPPVARGAGAGTTAFGKADVNESSFHAPRQDAGARRSRRAELRKRYFQSTMARKIFVEECQRLGPGSELTAIPICRKKSTRSRWGYSSAVHPTVVRSRYDSVSSQEKFYHSGGDVSRKQSVTAREASLYRRAALMRSSLGKGHGPRPRCARKQKSADVLSRRRGC